VNENTTPTVKEAMATQNRRADDGDRCILLVIHHALDAPTPAGY
jgi:hypothetical protein